MAWFAIVDKLAAMLEGNWSRGAHLEKGIKRERVVGQKEGMKHLMTRKRRGWGEDVSSKGNAGRKLGCCQWNEWNQIERSIIGDP